MLPLNNQLCNYIKDISPDCNFCKLAGKAHQDGFNHFFFKCPCTREFLAKFVTMLGLSLNLDSNDFHTLYWYGYNDDIKEHQTAFLTVFDSFRYVLYRLRNRHILPVYDTVERELVFFISKLCRANSNFKLKLLGSNTLARIVRAIG
jgi:hypothetical protein